MARRFMLLLVALLAACHDSSLERIDRELDALIRREQSGVLGARAVQDPQAVPPPAGLAETPAGAYDLRPPTFNPLPGDLPATAGRPTTQPAADHIQRHGGADDPNARKLDLPAALACGLAHSRSYRNAKDDLFLAAISLLAERHLWGPRLSDTVTAEVRGTPEGGDHDQALQLVNTLRLTHRLPYGGEAEARAVVSLIDQLRLASGGVDEQGQTAGLGFSITQKLLRGAGQAARADLIQAERTLVYRVRRFEHERRRFLVQIASDYYGLLQQQARIENVRRQVANFEWLQRRIGALANAGREPFFEVQRAEQQVLFARNELLSALEAYAGLVDRFKLNLGLPPQEAVVVVPTDLVLPPPALDEAAAVGTALRARLDLRTSADQVDDARRAVAEARNRTLPDLDLFASADVFTREDFRWGGANFDLGAGSYAAGLTLGLPLDRRRESLDLRRALVSLEAAQRSYSLESDSVVLEVRRTLRGIEEAQFSLDLQNRNIAVAEKRLQGVLLRLRTLGPRDFIEAQDDLIRARDGRDAALRRFRVSVLDYLMATGQMRVGGQGQWLAPGELVTPPAATAPAEADAARLIQPPAAATQPAPGR